MSVGLLLALVAGLVWFQVVAWYWAIAIGVSGYVVLESAFRRRLTRLTLPITVVMATVGALAVIWEFRVQALLAALVGLAALILA